jgi:hypothetical protein
VRVERLSTAKDDLNTQAVQNKRKDVTVTVSRSNGFQGSSKRYAFFKSFHWRSPTQVGDE